MKIDEVSDFNLYLLYRWDKEQFEKVYFRCSHEIHWNSTPYLRAIEIIRNLFIEIRFLLL